MREDDQKSFLELVAVWKDEHMIELSVTAANDDFYGRAKVYDAPSDLFAFATSLSDGPINTIDLFYELGKKDSYAYFSMRYYPIGFNGHIGIEVNLESNVANNSRPEEKDKLKLEIITEPSLLDTFQKELQELARTEAGKATLYGRDI